MKIREKEVDEIKAVKKEIKATIGTSATAFSSASS